jgi:flagellar biosynthesis protein FlhA
MQFFNMDPVTVDKVVASMKENFEKGLIKGYQPVVLCSPATRRFVKKMAERISGSLIVVSNAEVAPNTKVYSIGAIRID